MPSFKQVDVFSDKKFKGNPVAVFFDTDNLSTEQMAEMSAWTNLSEATFVEKPTDDKADYKVRIFSLENELPFAGHPTIGTCHALLEAGLIKPTNGKIIQQCNAGLVELQVDGDSNPTISFKLPYVKRRELTQEQIDKVTGAMNAPSKAINAAVYDVGPVWLTVQLDSAETVLGLKPSMETIIKVSNELNVTGFQVIGKYANGTNNYETRTFCPAIGVHEDPVCGSGSGATGAFLRDSDQVKGTVNINQGTLLKREGRVTVNAETDVKVGGKAVTVVNGDY